MKYISYSWLTQSWFITFRYIYNFSYLIVCWRNIYGKLSKSRYWIFFIYWCLIKKSSMVKNRILQRIRFFFHMKKLLHFIVQFHDCSWYWQNHNWNTTFFLFPFNDLQFSFLIISSVLMLLFFIQPNSDYKWWPRLIYWVLNGYISLCIGWNYWKFLYFCAWLLTKFSFTFLSFFS